MNKIMNEPDKLKLEELELDKLKLEKLKLDNLISIPSVSGNESDGTFAVLNHFKEAADETYVDNIGNIIGIKKSENSKFKIMLDAHYDSIGLMVSEILEGGFIKFVSVGGVDQRILPSLSVTIKGTKDILGIIGAKPPHLLSGGTDNAYKIADLYIDTGYTKEELSEIVSIGDVILFDSELISLKNNLIAKNGFDDKIGVYVILEILKNISAENVDIIGVATVGEEIGLKGAKALDEISDLDLAVVIDVSHGVTPDCIKSRAFQLSDGPVIAFGPALNREYAEKLKEYANKNNIHIQIEAEGGRTGTNSWAYHVARGGINTIMLSIPLKYMHTSNEVISLDDLNNTIKLLGGFIKDLDISLSDGSV